MNLEGRNSRRSLSETRFQRACNEAWGRHPVRQVVNSVCSAVFTMFAFWVLDSSGILEVDLPYRWWLAAAGLVGVVVGKIPRFLYEFAWKATENQRDEARERIRELEESRKTQVAQKLESCLLTADLSAARFLLDHRVELAAGMSGLRLHQLAEAAGSSSETVAVLLGEGLFDCTHKNGALILRLNTFGHEVCHAISRSNEGGTENQ